MKSKHPEVPANSSSSFQSPSFSLFPGRYDILEQSVRTFNGGGWEGWQGKHQHYQEVLDLCLSEWPCIWVKQEVVNAALKPNSRILAIHCSTLPPPSNYLLEGKKPIQILILLIFFSVLLGNLLWVTTSLPSWGGNLLLVGVTFPAARSPLIGSRGKGSHWVVRGPVPRRITSRENFWSPGQEIS